MVWVFIGFLPWIVYWSLSGPGLDVAGMGGALVVALLLNGYRVYTRNYKTLELVTLGYFVVAFFVTALTGTRLFVTYGGVLVQLALAGVAWGSLARRNPFTYEYAKEDWDPAFWTNPIFVETNQIITAVWGLIFTLNVLLNFVKLGLLFPASLIVGVILPQVGVVGGIAFSIWFPRYYPQRAAARKGGTKMPIPEGITGLKIVEMMPFVFNAEAAGDLEATIQLHLSGEGGGSGYLRIASGRCTYHPGEAAEPTLVIESPSEVWTAIARGERSGAEAYLTKAYLAKGDLSVLLKMEAMFGGTPKEIPTPQPALELMPHTCSQAIEGMTLVFNPEKAGDLKAVIHFIVTGEEPGDYTLRIEGGQCSFQEGLVGEPTLTITTPSDVWLAIARKEISGAQALMSSKYKAEGDFGLLMRMDEIFSRKLTEKEIAAKGWLSRSA
jgi:putative sterol carrier protein